MVNKKVDREELKTQALHPDALRSKGYLANHFSDGPERVRAAYLKFAKDEPEKMAELLKFDTNQARRNHLYETNHQIVDHPLPSPACQPSAEEVIKTLKFPSTPLGARAKQIAFYILDGFTQEEIGNRLGISRARVGQILKSAGTQIEAAS